MADGGQKKASWFSKPKNIVFAVACAIIGVLFVLNLTYHEPLNESFLKGYKEFDTYEQVNDDPVVLHVSKEGEEVGYLVIASHYGYQSDVEMATLVGLDGTVIDARAYAQNESPSYFVKLTGASFFKRNFPGKSIADGFDINRNVDAVSHATISSNAATKAVQKGVTYVGEHYLGIKVAPDSSKLSVGYLDILVCVMLVLALVTSRFAKLKWLVWVTRVYSIVAMGFLTSQFITLSVLVAFFSLDWPSYIDYLRWYILVFGVFILLLATGKNVYCNYMCPFGALQEIEAALAGPLAKKPLNPRLNKSMRLFPGALVFVSLALTLFYHNYGFANYEPFSLIFGQVGVGVQWALLPIVLVAALFSRRVYCSFVCPVGYVLTKVVIIRSKVARALKRKPEPVAAMAMAGAGDAPATDAASETTPKPQVKKPAGQDWIVLALVAALVVVSVLTIMTGWTA